MVTASAAISQAKIGRPEVQLGPQGCVFVRAWLLKGRKLGFEMEGKVWMLWDPSLLFGVQLRVVRAGRPWVGLCQQAPSCDLPARGHWFAQQGRAAQAGG